MSEELVLSNLTIQGHPVGLFYDEPTPPGPTFDTVTIGNQIWMSKNLTIDDGQGGIYTKTVNFGQGDVVEYYYDWDAAVRVAASITGWHLPSASEWLTLVAAIGGSSTSGTKLKSTYGWNDDGNGTDDYGFAGFPAGYLMNNGTFLTQFGNYACFWSSTPNQTSELFANASKLYKTIAKLITSNEYKTNCYSVRLVKDAT